MKLGNCALKCLSRAKSLQGQGKEEREEKKGMEEGGHGMKRSVGSGR